MGKSNSVDLRVRIVGETERGQSCRAAARRFGVSAATQINAMGAITIGYGATNPINSWRPISTFCGRLARAHRSNRRRL